MRKILLTTLLAAAFATSIAQVTPIGQMEKLDRGLIALPSNTGMGNFVSWRFLGTDAADTRFDLIRDGITIATNLTATNYEDWDFFISEAREMLAKQHSGLPLRYIRGSF